VRTRLGVLALALMHPAVLLSAQERTRGRAAPGAVAEPAAAVSQEQFRQFRWILGRWHGNGGGLLAQVPDFFEEYTALNDSTFIMRTFSDSTFTVATDSTRFELRNGRLQAVPERDRVRYATRVAADTIRWSGSGATYLRRNAGYWRALFASRGGEGEERFYEMHRLASPPPRAR